MAERIIQQADLNGIENNLRSINQNINAVNSNVAVVDENVKIIYSEIEELARDFRRFVNYQAKQNRLGQAKTELVKIRQEIEKKYGHYDIVRRTTVGILQATDLGVIRKETINTATEELMLSTPNYWLAPCLVALSAWINDKPNIADIALKEAIHRDDEKTSLFFAIVCRRADRKLASLKWTERYLASQDENHIGRKTMVLLDAYVNGLLGNDAENLISKRMDIWLKNLSNKDGFIEKQRQQWSDAINLRRENFDEDNYLYLSTYSKTWPQLKEIMEGALLHKKIFEYLTNIFEQKVSLKNIIEELDEILFDLVSNYDNEELPLRKQEKFEQLVVDFDGDEIRAKKNMDIEKSAFDEYKDFTQILTDAAMKPETSHASVSTQKLAIALSKDWILDAYNDIIAQNRMKIPQEITINMDTFNFTTVDGRNEIEVLQNFEALIQNEKRQALSQNVLTGFQKFCQPGGIAIAIAGLLMLFLGNSILGFVITVAGIGMVISFYSCKNAIKKKKEAIEKMFEEKLDKGKQILRAFLAEVVDFREEFSEKDAESSKVISFLKSLKAKEYIKRNCDANRKIKI